MLHLGSLNRSYFKATLNCLLGLCYIPNLANASLRDRVSLPHTANEWSYLQESLKKLRILVYLGWIHTIKSVVCSEQKQEYHLINTESDV